MTVRTRFAPSPTGYLHIGGARTALYCWLYARHCGGQFILRIEDTDIERSTPESVQAVLSGLQWLDLQYDEGPFYQTQHFSRYQEITEQLLASNHAYRCYCSKERLEKLRDAQMANKEKPRYDGHCRQLTVRQEGSFVIRFRNPDDGEVSFEDQVRGKITTHNRELDDLIITRSDGTPTYNFTVVVDDWDMKITHVIRGDDHINNTPRQINILKALNATIPLYAHLPMILGPDGKKLSKREGAASVMDYRDAGYLPQAVLNYLVRLGWSHGDQEIFSPDEMVASFDLKNLSRSAAALNPEKLLWLNHHYLKTLPITIIANELRWHLEKRAIDYSHGPSLEKIVLAQRDRVKTLKEMVEQSQCFYGDTIVYNEDAVKKNFHSDVRKILEKIVEEFSKINDWQAAVIHPVIAHIARELQLKMGAVALPVRIATTGGMASPPLDITLELIGKNRVLGRLEKARALCSTRS